MNELIGELWKTIAWTPEQEQIIYREWGLFNTKKQNLDTADLYYNKSLALNPDDPKALYSRSKCKRRIAQTEDALVDAQRALALDDLRQPFNLEVCDGIHQINEFEKTMVSLCNLSKKFTGKKVDAFNQRRDVVNENLNDALGDTLGYFIIENGKHFDKVYQEMMSERNIDPRPLWKILMEQKTCDILSVLEKPEILLSPMEIARRKRSFLVFNQIYLRRSWIDVLFLKALTTNENLLLPQSKWSAPILEALTKNKYHVVMKFIKMLHSRSPMYTEKYKACPNKLRRKQQTEGFLFRVQNQVHRGVLKILKTMRYLRENKRTERLRTYVEEVMGDYMVLKTHRVMPWKFKFTNEVYNILALALLDRYQNKKINFEGIPQRDHMVLFLNMKSEIEEKPIVFEFGKRKLDAPTVDKTLKYKALTSRLEKRLVFAKYHIERAYLWHEIALCELKQNRFDRCCLIANKALEEAELCNSNIWMFHATMIILKSHALLRKIEKTTLTLKSATEIAKKLKNAGIMSYLNRCQKLNLADIKAMVRIRVSLASLASKSRMSTVRRN